MQKAIADSMDNYDKAVQELKEQQAQLDNQALFQGDDVLLIKKQAVCPMEVSSWHSINTTPRPSVSMDINKYDVDRRPLVSSFGRIGFDCSSAWRKCQKLLSVKEKSEQPVADPIYKNQADSVICRSNSDSSCYKQKRSDVKAEQSDHSHSHEELRKEGIECDCSKR